MELHEELSQHENERQRHRENAARLATVQSRYFTEGQGSVEFAERVDFDCTFVEEPFLSYGARIDLDALANLLNLGPEADVPMPLTAGYVTEWDRDERDFYVGAWVGVRVHFPLVLVLGSPTTPPAPEPEVPATTPVEVTHYFSFAGIAMKDVPLEGAGEGADE